jgi:drug/metabolite transporter (DMT)-like permease
MQKLGWIKKLFNKHRLFIAGIFVFSALTHVFYLAPGGPSTGYPNPLFLVFDEGTVLYDSFRITCGEVMYRDFFQFQGPVFYHVYAGLFALTGPSIAAARALNLLITAFTATLIALLIAKNLGPLIGAIAAVVHACLLVPMFPYAYPHWLAETFAFAGIYLLVTSSGRTSRELAGGVFLGLCAGTIQSLGLPILAVCMVVLALPGIVQRSWRETYVHPLRVFGGALLSICPFIIYLGVVGALDQMWYAMIEWVLNNYSKGQKDAVTMGYGAYLDTFLTLHKRIGKPWRGMAMGGLQFVKFLPVFAIPGVIVATVQIIINKRRRSVDYVYLMIGTAAIAGTASLLLGITRVDIVHFAFVGSFGLCGAVITLKPLVTWKPHFRLPIAIVWIFIAIVVITNFSFKTVTTYRPSREMKGWREEILKLGSARWIDTNLGPNERVVSAWGGLHYLHIRRAAVGFTFLPLDATGYYSNEQWKKLGSQILKALPPVIEVTKGQWLQIIQWTPELMQHYQLYNISNKYLLLREGFTPLK